MMKMRPLVATSLTAIMLLAFGPAAVAATVTHMTTRCSNGKFFFVGFDEAGQVTVVKSNFGGVYQADAAPCRDLPDVKCSIDVVQDGHVTILRDLRNDDGVRQGATYLFIYYDKNDPDYGAVRGLTVDADSRATKLQLDCKAE